MTALGSTRGGIVVSGFGRTPARHAGSAVRRMVELMGGLRQTLAVGRPLASIALMVAGLVLAAGAAQAQTPILSLQATPSPFSPGQTISITASVAMNATVESFCQGPPNGYCAIVSMDASAQVTRPGGFSVGVNDWNTAVDLQTTDAGPGQSMQSTTYTLTGTVIVSYCQFDPFEWECAEPAQDYIESGSTQVTVTPVAAPSISGLNPSSAVTGTSVTISGTNFTSTQGTVTFNGAGASVSQWSDASITATVPGGATSGNVVVTAGGQSSNGAWFTVVTPPSLSGLNPTAAHVNASVTISGSQFGGSQGQSTVSFNGTAATVSQWSDTSITAAVPAGATSGSVVVTVSGYPSNGLSFTVIPPPSLSGLDPTSGPVGGTVTITGAYFGSSQGTSAVTFNGVPASTSGWTDTSITATVPAGATSGLVLVAVAGHLSNGLPFTVSGAGPPGACTFTDDPLQPGTSIKAAHVTELRTCINALRGIVQLSPVAWTDGTLTPQQTVMKAVHLTELRTGLTEVYTAWPLSPPSFTDTLTATVTPIKAIHIQELRQAVHALMGSGGPGGEGEEILYYHTDAIGSVRMTTNAAGATVARYDYLAFGQPWPGAAGQDPEPRRYAGMERDLETGGVASWDTLNYAGARYYSGQTGRFVSVDPGHMGFNARNPQTWNGYVYGLNNPLRYVDPDGRCSAPSGIGPGQVGICIEGFIAAKWFSGVARGDDRGFSGTDPDLTARSRIKVVVDGTEIVSTAVESARSGVIGKNWGPKGTTHAHAVAIRDTDGSVLVGVSIRGLNGMAGVPLAPRDPLAGTFYFRISDGGRVSFLEQYSSRTLFPSWGLYAYPFGGSDEELWTWPGTAVGDLAKGRQPIIERTDPPGLNRPRTPFD